MKISKEQIKRVGYFMPRLPYIDYEKEDKGTQKFIKALDEFVREWGLMDYDTKEDFILELKRYMRGKNMVPEDENMFIQEVMKNMPFKSWG